MAQIAVPNTWDGLQQAVDAANPGDELVCSPALICKPLVLRKKSTSGRILIRTAAVSGLPPDGGRIDPAQAAACPTIVSTGDAAVSTEPGAHDYVLQGFQIRTQQPTTACDTLVTLGSGGSDQTDASQVPQNLTLDRCLVTAAAGQTLKRGVGLNSGAANLLGCYIAGFKSQGQDSQAAAGWNGPGPFRITNCYLEAAGENVIFGGAAGGLAGCVPRGIEIRGNTFRKPLSWNPADPSFAGVTWSVKNLLEFKNAQDVLVIDNDFANCWLGSQTGFAILITPRGAQSGGSFVQLKNIRITGNRVSNVLQGFAVLGSDDESVSQRTAGIVIENNLVNGVGGARLGADRLGGVPRLFQVTPGQTGGVQDLTIRHNTILDGNYSLLIADPGNDSLAFLDNICWTGYYGILCQGKLGEAGLQAAFAQRQFLGNVVVFSPGNQAGSVSQWPAGNTYLTDGTSLGLKADGTGLDPTSPYKNRASDGTDPGCSLGAASNEGPPVPPPPPPTPPAPLALATATYLQAPSWFLHGDPTPQAVVRVVAADGASVAGTIKLVFDDGTAVHTLIDGSSVFQLSSLAAGTHTLQAVYPGNGTYAGSSSPKITVVVGASTTPPPPPPPPARVTLVLNEPLEAGIYTLVKQGGQ